MCRLERWCVGRSVGARKYYPQDSMNIHREVSFHEFMGVYHVEKEQ